MALRERLKGGRREGGEGWGGVMVEGRMKGVSSSLVY